MVSYFGTRAQLLAALMFCAVGAVAQSAPNPEAAPADKNWLKDPKTGCAVFNIDPQPGKSITWSGACQDGFAEGRGVLMWQDGSGGNVIYHKGKLNGHFAYAWKDGFHYLGDWVDGKRHGQGTLTWPEGDRYEGSWVNGKRDGHGVLTKVNGEKQDGTWYDDKFIQ